MYKFFVQEIRLIYDLIMEPIDIMFKLSAINKYKNQLNIGSNDSFGEFYYKFIEKSKNTGVIYTPVEISEYIIKNTVTEDEIVKNPFLKILDPACGCGNILIPCYRYLKRIYLNNLEKINKLHNINLNYDCIDKHIIENNIFGCDIDEISIKILLIDLFSESQTISESNFKIGDFLLGDDNNIYDTVIGNPPYVGHKTIDREYSKKLKLEYREIYKDKGDLSYCFFKQAMEKITHEGKISFITSRYFIEAPSGENLRKLILSDIYINKIVDFYGIRPFKNVGVDPIIIFMKKGFSLNEIEIIKPILGSKDQSKNFYNSVFKGQGSFYRSFKISKHNLKDKWMLIDQEEREIIEKINEKCKLSLGEISNSYQGIITGCDKAFILDEKLIEEMNIEKGIVRPWIKSSNIKKFKVEESNKYIIYSDYIDELDKYKMSIDYIGKFKRKLLNRRECINGIRKWYQLQWGRKPEIFEGEKIIFPYKADHNRFAVDNGSFFSADVYCLSIKPTVSISNDYLVHILNSKVYEFFFKCYGKKLGGKLYEYYPNTIMKLPIAIDIPMDSDYNQSLYNYFELSNKQIKIIEERIEI